MKKKSRLLLFLILSVTFVFYTNFQKTTGKSISNYYVNKLTYFLQQLNNLKESIQFKKKNSFLKKDFLLLRNRYKKVAIFLDYFNPNETKKINSPAIPRAYDDNYIKIIPPEGLQLIEELIFTNNEKTNYEKIQFEINKIEKIVISLLQEPQLEYKLRQELMLDAVQKSMIRLITLGITGFDTPVALNALPECIATLESYKEIIPYYEDILNDIDTKELYKLCEESILFIKKNNDFNTFNRMIFIKKYINPIYKIWSNNKIAVGYKEINEKRPLHIYANSLFDSTTFNINFFSPNDRFLATSERVILGKQLFYDNILSVTKNRNCGTCHKPELAFTDGLTTALSTNNRTLLKRNTPTLWNAALQTKQFYDSRTSTLENQINNVVHNQDEMSGSFITSIPLLKDNKAYKELFEKAYINENDKINDYTISNALASYIRSLISFNSKFDQYMNGNLNAMKENEVNGFNLFMGKGKCGTCHFMPLFNGLTPPEFTDTESEVIGVPQKNEKPYVIDNDEGRKNFTKMPLHQYAFKIPTLRNINETSPYMHNGVYKTLNEVVDFYNKGGGYGIGINIENQTLPKEKLLLTKKEKHCIVAFMKTLSNTK